MKKANGKEGIDMKSKATNKWFFAALVATMSVAVAVAPVAATTEFTDITKKHQYVKEIEAMALKEIIRGYPDGTFKPKEMITRKQAANLLARAFDEFSNTNAKKGAKITDVTTKNDAYASIKRVVEAGIMDVNTKGEFRPGDVMTRGEMAKSLAVAYDLATKGYNEKQHNFVDKSKMSNYAAANMLFQAGVTTGYTDGTFGESKGVSREHYAVFMFRATNLAKPETKPEPSKPTKPPTTLAPDVQEVMDLYANVKVPAGKNAADLSAENRQEAKAWDNSVSTNVFIENQTRFIVEETAKGLYTKFELIGYSKEETLSMLKKALKGEVVKGKSEDGNHYYMYFTFDDSKLVVGIERLDM